MPSNVSSILLDFSRSSPSLPPGFIGSGALFTAADAPSFETIKGEPLEKRNFRKWINAHWDLEDLEKKTTGGRHRPASLYKLKGPKKAA